ncbi:low temperature requirement protein A [Lactobacillus gasseri]|uniref:low temperature requirement protein A n=1 Tax=Lactobacillus gasseri TaxID=1596 RepID=UPI0006684DEA|nr:low temperature requirement protein A [Lactobacillus gasseri]
MKKISAKPVGMFELFYDLVFVYAISRITAMIHHPINGSIPLITFLQFLLVVIVVMQIWLYQVIYFNRYSKNSFWDLSGLVLNMFVAVYLANNINTEWRITFHYFNIAMAVMIVTLFCQYLFAQVDKNNDKKVFLIILGLEFFLIVVGLLVGYPAGIYFCIAGYIIGFILPLFLKEMFKAERVNFPHLVERVSLIVIIAFGEAIVNLATYFNNKTPLVYVALLFLSLVLMFASYVILSDKLINHHQISKGFVLMYSHIAIVVSILLMTVSLLYLQIKNVNRSFLFLLIIGSIALYYFSLAINQVYNKNKCKFDIRDFLSLLLIFALGVSYLWFVIRSELGIAICLLIWNLAFFLIFLMKSKNSLN